LTLLERRAWAAGVEFGRGEASNKATACVLLAAREHARAEDLAKELEALRERMVRAEAAPQDEPEEPEASYMVTRTWTDKPAKQRMEQAPLEWLKRHFALAMSRNPALASVIIGLPDGTSIFISQSDRKWRKDEQQHV